MKNFNAILIFENQFILFYLKILHSFIKKFPPIFHYFTIIFSKILLPVTGATIELYHKLTIQEVEIIIM